MSLDAVRRKSEQLLIAAMAINYPGTPVRSENVTFTQPHNGYWVDFKLSPGQEDPAELGANPMYRSWGVINITVLAPEAMGTKTALEICETIKNTFRNRRFSLGSDGYLTYTCVTIRNRGNLNGALAYGVMVEYQHSKV